MADVFISYRKADWAKAKTLAAALKIENVDVWWDTALEAGDTFDDKIQTVLEQVKCVVVIWSKESVKSEWVRAESSVGRERGILVPVMIQPVNIPVPFNLLHTADLIGWSGDRSHAGYQNVVKQVKELAGKSQVKPLRPPPNRAIRSLWRTTLTVAVVGAIGAALVVFRPWDLLKAKDPIVEARREAAEKREVSLNALAVYGLKPDDLDRHTSRHIAERIFKADMRDQLNAEAAKGDPAVLALKCAVDLWTLIDGNPDFEGAHDVCERAAATGEPAAQVFYGDLLLEASYLAFVNDEQTTSFKASAIAEYKKAADAGFGQGEIRYGGELQTGKNANADPVVAEGYLKSAQAKGLPEADYYLGRLYLSGLIPGPDFDEAIALVRKAADAGVQQAQSDMADELIEAFNVKEDIEAALVYRRACAKGIDPYVAFRCNESIPSAERRLAERKAEQAAAPAPAPN